MVSRSLEVLTVGNSTSQRKRRTGRKLYTPKEDYRFGSDTELSQGYSQSQSQRRAVTSKVRRYSPYPLSTEIISTIAFHRFCFKLFDKHCSVETNLLGTDWIHSLHGDFSYNCPSLSPRLVYYNTISKGQV